MAKLITDALKELFTAQGVTATGDTIADVLKDGNTKEYDATVSGNQIADVIAQTAETGTFSGGGAAPTVVKEITWDGNTAGLESHIVTIEETDYTFYKVSNSVLPYGVLDGSDGYSYETVDEGDETHTPKLYVFDGYVALSGGSGVFGVISAYFNNFASEVFGDEVLVPSVGTWIMKEADAYTKSVTAALEM